ncbi:MAG: recombinase family protein, partial [archaeon YNP-WB-062]|nr:recombinase family protein [Candidatus Culexarchaeum yellowstonense]
MSSVFNAVVYVRVSTREQDEDVQLRAVEGFASRLGVRVLKVYIDRGVSGGKPFRDRPAASQLLGELD